MATLTGANSVFMLSIAGLYVIPQQIQGYAVDDAFSVEAVATVEALMGVDGNMSAGFVHAPRVVTIALQGDSVSMPIFDNWNSAQEAAKELYWANAIITLPAVGQAYALRKGVLTHFAPIADVKKLLQPRKFSITFQNIIASPIG